MNNRLLSVFVLLLPASVGAGYGQSTTADGSFPGGNGGEERAWANHDPYVKQHADELKQAGLDPVSLLRAASKLTSAEPKLGGALAAVTLKDAGGNQLSPKDRVLLAFQYAKREGLRPGDIVREMEKGTAMSLAIEKVQLKSKGDAKAVSAIQALESNPSSEIESIQKKLQEMAGQIRAMK
jgi:hypothetical protein